jgi:pyridoxine/pyridoxamine 5'-phosphate oxidase
VNPIDAIIEDRANARDKGDQNASICFLALAGKDKKASVRTLVLREINHNRFVLYINRTSPKWQLLSDGADYEILLWYPTMQKQYRIRGDCEIANQSEVKTNWLQRPPGPKYMDYLYRDGSPQSTFMSSRQELVENIDRIRSEHDIDQMVAPDEAAGVELVANQIEMLDLNTIDQIHDRRLFTLLDDVWHAQVMVP